MSVSGAVRRYFRAAPLSSAEHVRRPVAARLLVQARKVTMMTLAHLLGHWPLIEIEAARGFVRDSSVELSPEVCSRLEPRSAGCSWVVGVNAVRGAPDGDLPEQAGARVAARGCPGGRGVGSAGVFSDVSRRGWLTSPETVGYPIYRPLPWLPGIPTRFFRPGTLSGGRLTLSPTSPTNSADLAHYVPEHASPSDARPPGHPRAATRAPACSGRSPSGAPRTALTPTTHEQPADLSSSLEQTSGDNSTELSRTNPRAASISINGQ